MQKGGVGHGVSTRIDLIKGAVRLLLLGTLLGLVAGCGSVKEEDGGKNAAGLNLMTSKSTLASDGSEEVTITALVKDAQNNLLEGETVDFSASSGALEVTQATTDATGRALAQLSPGGNPRNRTITVEAAVGEVRDSIEIEVVGTQISIDGPSSLVLGDTGPFTVILTDAGGHGIANQTVSVSSALGNPFRTTTLATDLQGQVQVDLVAQMGGQETIEASALGLTDQASLAISVDDFHFISPEPGAEIELGESQTVTIKWEKEGAPQIGKQINFATTRGTLTGSATATTGPNGEAQVEITSDNAGGAVLTAEAADGPSAQLELEFIATDPASLDLQADPFSVAPGETSAIRAVVRDPNNNPVKDQVVGFNLQAVTGGTLSVPSDTTDNLGRATTVYTAGGITSAKDGVKIMAQVRGATPIVEGEMSLTVAERELRLTLGTGNEIVAPNETQYEQPWVVQVTDANGNPVSGVDVEPSIIPEAFFKGSYVPADTDGDGTADRWAIPDPVRCPNEDTILNDEDANLNGILDKGEDRDGDGVLEPGNPATVSPRTITTNENGFGFFSVFYPQGNANWVAVKLEVQTQVEGTEHRESEQFVLKVLAEDVSDPEVDPPGGQASPYGTETDSIDPCADPN